MKGLKRHRQDEVPPSLISFMVSVDVKHHVYLLTRFHSESTGGRKSARGQGLGHTPTSLQFWHLPPKVEETMS